MSLYLKYRPKTIDELDLVGVRRALTDIVKANQVAHAYLMTGPRGAGKTSSARVLARIVNCEHNRKKLDEPCNECDACKSILNGSAVDVIEIDAASNRGIDDIRELKEKIKLSPAILPKKVYIIDEVHMLTTEAFNALLKTLEEPPSHALFILCTTEAHKVPETIVSRCVRIKFTKATPEEMMRAFTRVLVGEGAKTDEEALSRLAAAVDGSFRDGVKVLDQLLSAGAKVDLAAVEQVLQGVAGFSVIPLAEALVTKNLRASLTFLHEAIDQGVDLNFLLISLMRVLRDGLLGSQGIGINPLKTDVKIEIAQLIYRLDDIARKISLSPAPTILMEMAVIEWCGEGRGGEKQNPEKKVKTVAPTVKKTGTKIETAQDFAGDHLEVWRKLLGSLNGDSYSLGALLSKASPGKISGNELEIIVQYDFHRQQLMTEKLRGRLEELVSKVVGQPMRIACRVGTATSLKQPLQATMENANMTGNLDESLNLVEMAEEIFKN